MVVLLCFILRYMYHYSHVKCFLERRTTSHQNLRKMVCFTLGWFHLSSVVSDAENLGPYQKLLVVQNLKKKKKTTKKHSTNKL